MVDDQSAARPPRRATIVRPRLLSVLAGRFTFVATAVTAPAGFGKTTLLTQAMAENRLAPAGTDVFLGCTPGHAVASSLLQALARSLGAAPRELDTVTVDQVVEAIWHRSPEPVALVLDDLHEIPAGSPGAGALAAVVRALPGNGHVVLSGRPPLPVPLARLQVAGHAQQLGPGELAYTPAELAQVAERRGVGPDRLRGCGGWPALAELAAAAAPGVEAAFLWEEILAGVEPGRRRELALVAHVGPFDEPLVAAVLGRAAVDVATLLGDLPLVGEGPDGRRTIHALWRPHLAHGVPAADLSGARRRAGLHLVDRGDVAGGVRLLGEAGAWEDVSQVILGALGAAHPPVPADVVDVWLDGLPPELQEGPTGRLLAGSRLVDVDFPAAAVLLAEAAAAFRAAGQVAGEMACLAQVGLAAWWREDDDVLATVTVRVLELEAAGVAEAAPLAGLGRALVHDVLNDVAAALAELDRIPTGSLNSVWASLVDWLRALWLNHRGRPADSLAAADRARGGASGLLAPLVEMARLQARWFLGDGGALLAGLPAAVDDIEAAGLRDHTAVVAATGAQVLAHTGRADEAAAFLARARATGAAGTLSLVEVNLAVAGAALAVATGDEAGAARTLEQYLTRSPLLGAGHAAATQQRTLAYWYVLVPATRAQWDAAELGPCFASARELARFLVAVREGAPVPPWPAGAAAGAHLPLPWLAEVALARIGAGDEGGWELLEGAWPAAQPFVRTLAGQPGAVHRPARSALARLPVPPRGRLDLRLLGPTELRRDGVPVDGPGWRRERVRSLLAHLVVHRPSGRERTADDLWPTLDAEGQSRNLRVTLSYLLRVLEPERAERDASFLVTGHGGGLLLHRGDWFTCDLWRFDERCEAAREADRQAAPSLALARIREAVDLWRGPPTDLVDEWARDDVERRTAQLVALATRASELLLARGEPDEALRMAEAARRADPWSDRAHAAAIAVHVSAGDHLAAHRAVRRYREALDELGVDRVSQDRMLGRLPPVGGDLRR